MVHNLGELEIRGRGGLRYRLEKYLIYLIYNVATKIIKILIQGEATIL